MNPQLINKLKYGRIDALCIAKLGLAAYSRSLGMTENDIGTPFIIENQEGYLQFSTNSKQYNPEVVRKLRDGFESLRQQGILSDIDKKYFEK